MSDNLSLPTNSAKKKYKSPSQIARVVTEAWVASNLYCPACKGRLVELPANTKAKDFVCANCGETFQLKSKRGKFPQKILGAEYKTTLASVTRGVQPSLILLEYSDEYQVQQVLVIHRSYITESAIVPRKPLGKSARRAGWQGCMIDVGRISAEATIPIIFNSEWLAQDKVLQNWQRATNVLSNEIKERRWLVDILRVLDNLNENFSLQDVYRYEEYLSSLHPSNSHVRAKIRQQLQVLRDKEMLLFLGNGIYRKINGG